MAKIDLNGLTMAELVELQEAAARKVEETRERDRDDVKAQVMELIEKRGYTFDNLFGDQRVKKRAKAAPKYRDPRDASLTWSGRGKRPRWYAEALEAGISKEDMLIFKD